MKLVDAHPRKPLRRPGATAAGIPRPRVLALVVVIAVLLTGCGAAQTDSHPTPSARPIAGAGGRTPPPLEAYAPPTSGGLDIVVTANQLLTADCLRKHGFEPQHELAPPPATWADTRGRAAYLTTMTDPSHGYGLTHSPAMEQYLKNLRPGDPPPSAAYTKTENTCHQQAYLQLTGSASKPFAHDDQVTSYSEDAEKRTMQDPRMLAAEAKWSACLAKAGFTYANTDAIGADDRAIDDKAYGLRLAHADAGCEDQTGLVKLHDQIRDTFEKQTIEQHAEFFTDLKRLYSQEAQRATKVLTSHASGSATS